ncbi:MAG: UbiA-like protein EboC [Bacteroidota bacterium]
MKFSLLPFLQLMRPANIVTALADILAGAAIALAWSVGEFSPQLGWLLLATVGLYGGGVVFNDVFDADLDREERPERPIPSGRISLSTAAVGGFLLLLLGVIAAAQVSALSASIALVVASLAVGYDKFGKHHVFFGPLMMGMCRGGNLLLGMSIVGTAVTEYWFIALIPVVFIGDITLTSRGEVHGGVSAELRLAVGLDIFVLVAFGILALVTPFALLPALPFLLLWASLNLRSKANALRLATPQAVMRAVKMGVLSLIPLNATLAAGFLGWSAGLLVLLLLPLSLILARYFAVT